jgi:hypothetical protein
MCASGPAFRRRTARIPKLVFLSLFFHFLLPNVSLRAQGNDSMQGTVPTDTMAVDSARMQDDTARRRLGLNDFRSIVRIVRTSWEIRQIIKNDYADLLLMKGWHPMFGYQYQGFGSLQLGLGYGRRHLFKPLAYNNAHMNLVWAPNRDAFAFPGLSIGFTRSQNIIFYGLEAAYLPYRTTGHVRMLRPEIGFSFLGAWNIGYGYSFFAGGVPDGFSRHSFVFRYTQQFLIRSAKCKYVEASYILNRDRARLQKVWEEIEKDRKP